MRGVMLLALLVGGCSQTYRYRLPYASTEIQQGWPCVQQCENQKVFSRPGVRGDELRGCLAKCPGVIVDQAACRAEDLPP